MKHDIQLIAFWSLVFAAVITIFSFVPSMTVTIIWGGN